MTIDETANTETDTTTKSKPLNIKVSNPETIALFNELKGQKSNNTFLTELLDIYEKVYGIQASEERNKDMLKNMLNLSQTDTGSVEEKKEKRDRKEQKIRELFELDANDPLSVSEHEILEVAHKITGKELIDMCLEGRLLIAKQEIGRYTSESSNKGKADDRILTTLEFMKAQGHKISLNRLTQVSGSNRRTVEDWCARNNITFDKK